MSAASKSRPNCPCGGQCRFSLLETILRDISLLLENVGSEENIRDVKQMFEKRLERLRELRKVVKEEVPPAPDREDVFWAYTETSLIFLTSLSETFAHLKAAASSSANEDEMVPPPDLISVKQERDILKLCEGILGFGVYPYMEASWYKNVQPSGEKARKLVCGDKSFKKCTHNEKQARLRRSLHGLLQCCIQSSRVAGILVPHYLPGMIVGTAQAVTTCPLDSTGESEKLLDMLHTLLESGHSVLVIKGVLRIFLTSRGSGCQLQTELAKFVANLLVRQIQKPDGVSTFLLDFLGSRDVNPRRMEMLQRIANILVLTPLEAGHSFPDHLVNIAKQLSQLLSALPNPRLPIPQQIFSEIILQAAKVNKEQTRELLFHPLIAKLLAVCRFSGDCGEDSVPLLEAAEFESSVENCHKLLLRSRMPDDSLTLFLVKGGLVDLLFHAYVAMPTILATSARLRDCLVKISKCVEEDERPKWICNMFLRDLPEEDLMNGRVSCICGDDGHVSVVACSTVNKEEESLAVYHFNNIMQNCQCIEPLFQKLCVLNMKVKVFLCFLQKLEGCRKDSGRLQVLLLCLDHLAQELSTAEDILELADFGVPILRSMLEGALSELENADKSIAPEDKFLLRPELFTTILNVVASMTLTMRVLGEHPEAVVDLAHPLLRLGKNEQLDKESREFCRGLAASLKTLGAVPPTEDEASQDDKEIRTRLKEILRVNGAGGEAGQKHSNDLSTNTANKSEVVEDVTTKSNHVEEIDEKVSHESVSFEKAWDHMTDDLLPVRAGGCLRMTQLLRTGHRKAWNSWRDILMCAQKSLEDCESYLYMGAIKLLAVMADRKTDEVLPVLVREYTQCSKPEIRIKVGEVLMKTTKNFGEMAAKYKDILLPAFLTCCRDPDEDVRTSGVSNMSDYCALLRYSFSSHIHEIVNCIGALYETDSSIAVRRAAIFFIANLLQALGDNSIEVLQEILLDLNKILRSVDYRNEEDRAILEHQLAASVALNKAMRKFVFPDPLLTKQVNVTKFL